MWTAFFLSAVLAGCSGWNEKPDPTKGWSARRIYTEARAALNDGDYETAVDYFEKLESRYPFGPYAQQAQLEVIYAYYKFEEPASAIAAADRFIKLHPRHPHTDYAYYIKGLTNFNQGASLLDRFISQDKSQRDPGAALDAFRTFSELVQRFPDSKYAEDSRQRMLYLRNNLAHYEIHVAKYYMRRGAYVAAANRARYVVENYQRTTAVPDALVVMATAYKVMGMTELYEDTMRVLRLNYPENPQIAKVESLVLEN